MAEIKGRLPTQSTGTELDAFLRKVAQTPKSAPHGERGRLIFALDATASREPTWDRASHIQAEMFSETAALGGLDVQLVYYRGFRELHASKWARRTEDLLSQMTGVLCRAGRTQIVRVLDWAIKETKAHKVNALVFIGDAFEEQIDRAGHSAGELGLLGLPCFMFHEGGDPAVASAFQQIARLSGGAYCRFDAGSARQLKELLRAVAVFAAGGHRALADYSKRRGGEAARLEQQMARLTYKDR
jgi:hypothetical protein